MSIADQITELTTIRGDIRTALTGKGVSASDHNFADFAADIDNIPSGGGEVTTPINLTTLSTPNVTCEYNGGNI